MEVIEKIMFLSNGTRAVAYTNDAELLYLDNILHQNAEPVALKSGTGWSIPCYVSYNNAGIMSHSAGRIVYDFGQNVQEDAGNYDWDIKCDDTLAWIEIY